MQHVATLTIVAFPPSAAGCEPDPTAYALSVVPITDRAAGAFPPYIWMERLGYKIFYRISLVRPSTYLFIRPC